MGGLLKSQEVGSLTPVGNLVTLAEYLICD